MVILNESEPIQGYGVRQSVDQIGLALADFLDGKRPAIWLEWLEEEDYGEDEG